MTYLVWFITGFFKMGQSRPLFVYFRHFLIIISIIKIGKNLRWCAWDSNPWLQDGRRRQNHGAISAAHSSEVLGCFFDFDSIKWGPFLHSSATHAERET